jgi:hypothetical protein
MAIKFLPYNPRDEKCSSKKLNVVLYQRVARSRLRGGGERRIPAYPSQQSQPQRSAIYLVYAFFFISLSVADPDPGSGIRAFLTPAFGIRDG